MSDTVIVDPPAIARAMLASNALGLAGSSAMERHISGSQARQLVARIAAAKATIKALSDANRNNGFNLSAEDDAKWDAAEAEQEHCRAQLQTLISERLGVCPEDLANAL